jgi:putative transport protein
VLSRLGHLRNLIWHMPLNANLAFRELGITLFLAAVGLKAGEKFFETVFTQTGLIWLMCALAIVIVPLLAIGAIARGVMKMNYTTLSGLIAGSTTDPPALAFAGMLAKSDGPNVAYATVYPLTMVLRIVAAQTLVLLLCR